MSIAESLSVATRYPPRTTIVVYSAPDMSALVA